ncbi:flagellar hook-basal body complex protein [Dyella acidisoli]|uniref:Flagellar hook protein FlgE n=1 Tax=Dyella acidisoli TaxID=1867834 RepID=A0ABQ5XQH0_9GAMM|nr:flagellar hook-basal body complex protein [Dyella acidisoli]GLQ92745.1 flagellar hook protein FlgE [Dyella acidisoli]
MTSGIMQALYNSVSGLFGFSQSLDTISNNISNMNTPGFRGSDSFFENVLDDDGTKIAGTGADTSQGQIEQTSTSTDVAIQGEGLFILKDPQGNLYYTRSGQFDFNASGQLEDSVNKYLVQGYSPTGSFGNIDISSLKTLPAVATTTVNMVGNIFSTSSTSSSPDTISNITVYDALGTAHTLTMTLTVASSSTTPTTSGSSTWNVAITDSSGATLGSGQVTFDQTGAPEAGANQVTMTANLGGKSQSIAFNFGTPGSLSGATGISGEPTSLAAKVQDGHGVIGISSESFDTNGVLQLTYADGSTHAGPQLALASFPDEGSMTEIQGNLYLPPQTQTAQIGRPGTDIFGKIDGSSLEMSNVDLTKELADMIVLQRGYQASSRVMTVSSDMLQQLYDSTRGS